jgi:hypothetical protein
MKNKNHRILGLSYLHSRTILATGLFLLINAAAYAQPSLTFSDANTAVDTTGAGSYIKSIASVFMYASYLAGIVVGIIGVVEFTQKSDWATLRNKLIGVGLLVGFAVMLNFYTASATAAATD